MRRILLITTLVTAVGLLASTQTSRKTPAQTSQEISPAKSKGYVLQPDEGEKLADPRGGIIKVSPQAGSQRLSMVVQPLTAGNRIGVHMHERDEEVFFVHKGKGTVILDDKRTPVEEGSVVYIPPGTWHGFDANDDMQLVWLISPPHFVELYRLFFKPGFETTKEEEERLKAKYGYRAKASL
ncbi:MAG: cupin domain-containing protein [Pyrinomonadaceae bacterium]|nr:cupin domain-containing protein [Pyrinomonadaceae bacterium]